MCFPATSPFACLASGSGHEALTHAGASQSNAALALRYAHIMSELARLNELGQAVLALKSFEPGPDVNALFGELVEAVLLCDYDPSLLELSFSLGELRDACAEAESALEFRWAQRLAAGDALSSFPYVINYELLSAFELGVVEGALGRSIVGMRVAFAGSGPLPLSALLLHEAGAVVTAIDIDADANAAAARWLEATLGASPIEFDTADIAAIPSLAEFDVVFLAALVGSDVEAKTAILRQLGGSMRPNALLVARSAMGMRCVISAW